MTNTFFLRYLGCCEGLRPQLAPLLERQEMQWKMFEDAEDLLDECQQATLAYEASEILGQGPLLGEAYAPVIMDVSDAAFAASILRELKEINRGIPVIILSERSSLTSFSLAQLDGAEALFHQPLVSLEPVWDAIERANRRVQQWVATLETEQSSTFS